MGRRKTSSRRKVYTDKCLHEEERKLTNKQGNLHLKELEEEKKLSPNIAEGNNNDQSKIK